MLQVLVNVSQKVSIAEKEAWAMQKLFMKIKVLKKWTSVQDIENNGYLDAHPKKREEMNNIAHVFLQSCF